MLTLYHGSQMAEDWAVVMAGRKGRNAQPVLNTYQFNLEQATDDGIRIKSFPSYDLEWLDYVVACRRGKDVSDEFDIVEGGIANDNVIDTVEDYEKGIITAEQALGQLRYKKVNHQLCILNQAVTDKYLTFTESILLEPEEDEP